MLFNSFEFLLFLPIVFVLYWFFLNKKLSVQNALILVASYVFYGWWDYRFLSLIFFSTLVDYFIGISLGKNDNVRTRKILLGISVSVNLGLLGFFKYYNFFIESWIEAWGSLGVPMSATTLKIILPVGISFYTFQTLSYSIDVYRRKLEPSKNFVAFAAYVAFFPQLVAGPIERATNLLPQFLRKRSFDYNNAVLGLRLMLYGLFKKIVIADSVAPLVNDIFKNYQDYSSPILIAGTVLFAIQIYGDFSGYSDIAIGTARLFGIKLMTNFRVPYFSRNIGEFWRRWHISLSTWFRDYVYIPLGGSRGSKLKQLRNVFIIFIVSGFWHGANLTFIIWGALHALFFIPLLFIGDNRKYLGGISENRWIPKFKEALSIITTFSLVCFAWIFFRADTVTVALQYVKNIFKLDNFWTLSTNYTYNNDVKPILFYLFFFLCIEWYARNKNVFIGDFFKKRWLLRYLLYFGVILSIILNITNEAQSFIYFQF